VSATAQAPSDCCAAHLPARAVPIVVEIFDESPRECPPVDRTWHRLVLLAAVVVVAAAATLEIRGERSVGIPGVERPLPELCMWRQVTGMDCAGCGLTRSFVSLAHGDVAAAWRFHPVGALLFIAVAAQIPWQSWQLRRIRAGRQPRQSRWAVWIAWSFVPLFIGQWIVRLWLHV